MIFFRIQSMQVSEAQLAECNSESLAALACKMAAQVGGLYQLYLNKPERVLLFHALGCLRWPPCHGQGGGPPAARPAARAEHTD